MEKKLWVIFLTILGINHSSLFSVETQTKLVNFYNETKTNLNIKVNSLTPFTLNIKSMKTIPLDSNDSIFVTELIINGKRYNEDNPEVKKINQKITTTQSPVAIKITKELLKNLEKGYQPIKKLVTFYNETNNDITIAINTQIPFILTRQERLNFKTILLESNDSIFINELTINDKQYNETNSEIKKINQQIMSTESPVIISIHNDLLQKLEAAYEKGRPSIKKIITFINKTHNPQTITINYDANLLFTLGTQTTPTSSSSKASRGRSLSMEEESRLSKLPNKKMFTLSQDDNGIYIRTLIINNVTYTENNKIIQDLNKEIGISSRKHTIDITDALLDKLDSNQCAIPSSSSGASSSSFSSPSSSTSNSPTKSHKHQK